MRLKRILTLLVAVVAMFMTTVSAQPGGGMGGGMGGPGGGMGGPRGGQGGPERMGGSSIDPVAMTGYFEIDAEKAIKKCKVKDEASKSAMRTLLADFAIKSGDVYSTHPEEFANMEEMKDMIAAAQMGESSDDMRTKMRSMMEGTMVVKREMTELHKTLNAGVEAVLADDEKSLSRWKLYYKDLCESNNFSDRAPRQRGEGSEGGRPEGGPGGGGMGGF
ncbi:MAG: hypothetical protein R3Y39_03215 [Rikenellaceae bacterium]